MALDIETVGEIDAVIGSWCLNKVTASIKAKLDHDYEIDGQAVTLFEVRPIWRGSPGQRMRLPFARFRYVKSTGLWQIYWMRQNGKWNSYEPASAACTLEEALDQSLM